MNKIIINDKAIEIDEEGYLADLCDWTPEICNKMAEIDNLVLTDSHWEIINFLREYYEEYQIAPAVRVLVKSMRKQFGPEKGTSDYLFSLFPDGTVKLANRYAGLPLPTC